MEYKGPSSQQTSWQSFVSMTRLWLVSHRNLSKLKGHTHTHTKHTSAWNSKRKQADQKFLHWNKWKGEDWYNLLPASTVQWKVPGGVWERKEVAKCCWEYMGTLSQEQNGSGKKMWLREAHLSLSASIPPLSYDWGLKSQIWLNTLLYSV